MKKLILKLWLIVSVSIAVNGQNQLQIHHVNIGNGDCTIISLVNNNTVIYKAIIDGGNSNFATSLGPYLNQQFASTHFNLLVLSHFHKDHYNGLMGLQNGTITADSIVDGGFYDLQIGNHAAQLEPPNQAFPPPRAPGVWEDNISDYGNNINNAAIRAPSVTNIPNQIGNGIRLGAINGVNVWLYCIAGNGSNIAANNGQLVVQNNIINGRNNQNNYSIGWLLIYGRFRYYTAGDIGGYSANYQEQIPYGNGQITVTGSCGAYTDQETTIAQGLSVYLPNAQPINGGNNFAGHVCALKISHHGSSCSNNANFLNTMKPAAFFTSAGSNGRWKLPKLNTLYKMSQAPFISNSVNVFQNIYNRGYYFTNLYNFAGQYYDSRTYANTLFSNQFGVSYDYGNNNANTEGSYVLVVPDQNGKNMSEFGVFRINCPPNPALNIPQQVFLGRFQCHQ